MRRGLSMLALAALLFGATAVQADYLFMQYIMGYKKPAPTNQGGNQPPNTPPTTPPNTTPGSDPNEADIIPIPVHAVVEVSRFTQTPNYMTGRLKATIKHEFGVTSLYNDDKLSTRLAKLSSVKTRFVSQRDAAYKTRAGDKVFGLAEWALKHNLIDEFVAVMDEAAKGGKKTGYDPLDRGIEAFTQVKAALAQRVDRDDAAQTWRGKLGFRMTPSDHYVLLYNAAVPDPPEVQRRLRMLEDNMRGVYYWFALRGIVLPMPDQKLVAVLLDQPDQFILQRQYAEDEPLITDGFFAARDNVVVFSAKRLDFAAEYFGRQMQAYYQQGWDRAALLSGKGAKLTGKTLDEYYMVQTLALLDKALEDEAERATVTHEGTRQLLVACGLQKHNVVMPDWVQFGVASVFETPKGPFPGAPPELKIAYWPGFGAPSWQYARLFKLMEGPIGYTSGNNLVFRNRIEFTKASQLMLEVVSDSEFALARALGPDAGRGAYLEARTHAWALCYFLTVKRTKGVIRLYEELSKLPRDLEPQPDEVVACFCRAFDVADATRTKRDPAKFEELAKDWLGFMQSVVPPGAKELNLGVTEVPSGGPGGGPGGAPGGGGSKGGGGSPKGPTPPRGG